MNSVLRRFLTEERGGGGAMFTTDQRSFRARNDDGSQTAATWKATQNTDWSQAPDENFRVRFEIQETAGAAGSLIANLQYELNISDTWVDVTDTSAVVRAFSTIHYTDGDLTTNQLTGGTGTFAAGRMDELDGTTDSISIAASGHTEVEYCCQILSADVANDDTVRLRIVNNKFLLGSYTVSPLVTVVEAVPPPEGSASGTFSFTGSSTGSRASAGSASGTDTWAGSATGSAPTGVSEGSASGTWAFAGSATGESPAVGANEGSASGTWTFSGSTTGSRASDGSVSGTDTWIGSATGVAPEVGLQDGFATGTFTFAGTATGARASEGSVSGSNTWAGSATGSAPAADEKSGLVLGAVSWSGLVTGARVSSGEATGTHQWAGSIPAVPTFGPTPRRSSVPTLRRSALIVMRAVSVLTIRRETVGTARRG